MKTIFDGFLWAVGIALGLGVVSLVYSVFGGSSFDYFCKNEFLTLQESEYQELKSVTRKVPSEKVGMFTYKVTGSVVLKNRDNYEAIEVIVSLYNSDGVFLGQYSGGAQYITEQEPIEFSIDVWEPFSEGDVADQKIKISAKRWCKAIFQRKSKNNTP